MPQNLHHPPFTPGDLSLDLNATTPPSSDFKQLEDKSLATTRGPIAPRTQASYGRDEARARSARSARSLKGRR